MAAPQQVISPKGVISLRGVAVHNLQRIDLDLPRQKLIVFCGLSGSGKSSLAFDTLYAEGQRRYIETFSAYTRQFLEQLEKPAAERIDGIPPAIAVARGNTSRSSRSTVGTTTETTDYLRLLFAKIGQVVCQGCGQPVRRQSPQSAADELAGLPAGLRYLLCYPLHVAADDTSETVSARLKETGFRRVIVGEQLLNLDEAPLEISQPEMSLLVVMDRLVTGKVSAERLRESVENAFEHGGGTCLALVDLSSTHPELTAEQLASLQARGTHYGLQGSIWQRLSWSRHMTCDRCQREYPEPEPRLYSFNSPLGACPECEGFGNVIDTDMDLVVPDREKSLREGAIAPWNTPSYKHELDELLALAPAYDIPVDVPVRELEPRHWELITHGVPQRKFGGLDGFFAWLERKKYKMHVRVFLSRWRSYSLCPACGGSRLRPEALATQVGGLNIAQINAMKISEAVDFFSALQLTPWEQAVGKMMLEQVRNRLDFLHTVGLGYLTLDRTMRTLSGGEASRVGLTSALGSSLVNMLYVLDEPTVGLHPRDTDRLVQAMLGLRNRGNTVVVVEHEEAVIRAADQVIEIGPEAGQRGGKLVFQGTPAQMQKDPASLTGDYLSGRRAIRLPESRRAPNHGWIRLAGARGNNLKNVTVEFPLGVLCVVTGVSGSGKSTLIQDTLYPALCRRLRKEAPRPADYDDVFGDGQLDDVVLVDQSPIGRSPRSNPVTYVKAFDEIRAAFADTVQARTRNYGPGHFSFNVEGGRCPACQGDGHVKIDMQFLPDVYMKCGQCHGRRFKPEILEVTYRGRNINDVLEMTVRQAFTFFRGSNKVLARLKRLMDVGLDYLRLGQPANTLSGGEAQRLKLAAYMSSSRRGRALFLLDEPTTGLHFADIVQLQDCFDALLAVGHSLIVVEHSMQLIKAADYIVDIGPDAAEAGGQVVCQGTPEAVANCRESITGQFLAKILAHDRKRQTA